jgi:hypothetical protein
VKSKTLRRIWRETREHHRLPYRAWLRLQASAMSTAAEARAVMNHKGMVATAEAAS